MIVGGYDCMMSVEEAITGRRSIRAFLPKAVPRPTIEKMLRIAGRAPSGSNIQPWKVHVLTGQKKAALSIELQRLHNHGEVGTREYNYYPVTWREPYMARRRACGLGLYKTLGLGREDKAGMHAQHGRNYAFFDAPVGLIFSIDRDMERGSWLDMGMFIQSVMLAARGEGLETCPQAAFAGYPDVVQRMVGLPAEEMVVCGVALGFADPDAVVNRFVTDRLEVGDFVRFVDDVAS
jgi:nitroreductase